MPDWKNEEDYVFTYSLSIEGWAWEFLRRNLEYQADYERAITYENKFVEQYEQCKHFQTNNAPSLNDSAQLLFIYEPERSMDESESQWRMRCINENKDPVRYRPSIGYGKKWNLTIPIQDYEIDTPPKFKYPEIKAEEVNWDSIGQYFKSDEDNFEQEDTYLLLAFDLKLPINKQLKSAKKLLDNKIKKGNIKKLQGISNKDLTAKWKLYLRVLDSNIDNVRLNELASVLTPDKDNSYSSGNVASKALDYSRKAAKKMMETDFVKILLLCTKE